MYARQARGREDPDVDKKLGIIPGAAGPHRVVDNCRREILFAPAVRQHPAPRQMVVKKGLADR